MASLFLAMQTRSLGFGFSLSFLGLCATVFVVSLGCILHVLYLLTGDVRRRWCSRPAALHDHTTLLGQEKPFGLAGGLIPMLARRVGIHRSSGFPGELSHVVFPILVRYASHSWCDIVFLDSDARSR